MHQHQKKLMQNVVHLTKKELFTVLASSGFQDIGFADRIIKS